MDGFVPAHFLGWYIKVGLEQKKTQKCFNSAGFPSKRLFKMCAKEIFMIWSLSINSNIVTI